MRIVSRPLSEPSKKSPSTPLRWQPRSRTGMRELTVRAMVHGAAMGRPGDAAVATMLAADIDNPRLASLVSALDGLAAKAVGG